MRDLINGEAITTYRNKKNWTQNDLAKAAGISVRQVSRIETTKSDTTTDVLLSLAAALGCAPQELLVQNPILPQPLES